jgi:hypothetical protein
MHMIALNYPENPTPSDKLAYKMHFESLRDVLPCAACATNYGDHLNEMPIERFLDSNAQLFAWTVHVHNIVNVHAGKRKWTPDEAAAYYAAYTGEPSCSSKETQQQPDHRPINSNGGRYESLRDMLVNFLILLACLIVAVVIGMTIYQGALLAGESFFSRKSR